MDARRPRALEAGLFALVVGLPLALFPQARSAFIDPKLFVLTLGALLLVISWLPVDRGIAVPALIWCAAIALAAAVGVDRLESLVGTVRATGVVLLVCTAALVAVAPSVSTELLERARGWMVWTGLAVAGIAVLARLAPEAFEPLVPRLGFGASTLGHPLRLAGFLAACLPAALSAARPRWLGPLAVGVLALGLASVDERSAYVLPVIALAASAWFLRPRWRRVAVAALTVVAAFALWSFIPSSAVSGQASDRFSVTGQFRTLEGERQRLAVYGANLRAFADRPVLGWGPANAGSGFLSSGTREQIETAGRNWADAHNLILELAVASGVVGLAAFGWLVLRLAPRAFRPVRERAWLAASAATLGAYALVEPLDVVLTPLLFLFAGAAAGQGEDDRSSVADLRWGVPVVRPEPAPGVDRLGRAVAVAVVAAATIVATANLTASALEEWAHTHYGSRWAVRTALGLAPWRLTASEVLAIDLALDGRAGDPDAAAEARRVAAAAVERHPRHPSVRLLAADVELLLRDVEGARTWIRWQLEVFPNDLVRPPTSDHGDDPPSGGYRSRVRARSLSPPDPLPV